MAKVAVVLSGCGVFDGSECHETVLALLRLDIHNSEVQCFAPDMQQLHVINHLTGKEKAGETRNVLEEAARLARGKILNVAEASANDFDALILPGGAGAAKNISNFSSAGADCQVQEDVLALARAMHDAGKPIGLICIAPALSALICGEGVECSIGNDAGTANAIEAMGGKHIECTVGDVVLDRQHMLVTTPAYMLAGRISEAAEGVFKLVDTVLELAD